MRGGAPRRNFEAHRPCFSEKTLWKAQLKTARAPLVRYALFASKAFLLVRAVCCCCSGKAGAAVDVWRCGSVLPHLQSMPSVQQKRAVAIAGALAAPRQRHNIFRAERVLPAAERRLTVTPHSAEKRRKRTFCLVFDRFSGRDTRAKSAQNLEKTTYPALDHCLSERARQDQSWPEKGHFRCRTWRTARTSSAVGGRRADAPRDDTPRNFEWEYTV